MPNQQRSKVASTADLKAHRQRRGVTLEQIADRTKISIRFLQAIEAGEFGKLPGGIFATSYLRQYASNAGIVEQDLLALYERETGAVADQRDLVAESGNCDPSAKTFIRTWWSALANDR